jgi:hypothetical protein
MRIYLHSFDDLFIGSFSAAKTVKRLIKGDK